MPIIIICGVRQLQNEKNAIKTIVGKDESKSYYQFTLCQQTAVYHTAFLMRLHYRLLQNYT